MSEKEPKHLIRFSVDISSIRKNRFYGKIFVICKENQKLNKKQYRTQPLLELSKVSANEQVFTDGFFTFERKYNKDQLFDILENETINLEVCHQDRNRNQTIIAQVKVQLKSLKNLPFKKTEYSYVKLFDSFHKIEDIDPTSEGKKIGELRVKVYLEDLGTNQNQKFEENLLQMMEQEPKQDEQQYQNQDEFTLEELEMKIVWELETWKKSEEQKFIMLMKKKELEMLNDLQQKMSQKQKDQQKAFNNYEAKLFQIEQQLRAKSADLQRREFQIKNFENMMKDKIKIFAEEQLKVQKEIKKINEKFEDSIKDLKSKVGTKQKQVVQLEKKVEQKDIQIKTLKEQLDDSPVSHLKKELQQKDLDVKNLQDKIEKFVELKKEYQKYIKDQQIEIEKLKGDNQMLRNFQIANQNKRAQDTSNVFKELKNELYRQSK